MNKKNLALRISSGVLYIALIAMATLYNPMTFIVIFLILFGLCFFELTNILKFDNKLYIAGSLLASGYVLYQYVEKFYSGANLYDLQLTTFLPVFLFLLAIYLIFYRPIELAFDSSKLIFTTIYLAIPFGLTFASVYKFHFENLQSVNHLFLAFVYIWLSDSFAYLIGSLIGKTPFTRISPNKTLEGLIGGFICCIAAGFLVEYLYPNLQGNQIIVSLLVAIGAPLGDLAESRLKRVFGVKDSSNMIPGHGGFLDRLDSFLVVIVLVYTYFLFI